MHKDHSTIKNVHAVAPHDSNVEIDWASLGKRKDYLTTQKSRLELRPINRVRSCWSSLEGLEPLNSETWNTSPISRKQMEKLLDKLVFRDEQQREVVTIVLIRAFHELIKTHDIDQRLISDKEKIAELRILKLQLKMKGTEESKNPEKTRIYRQILVNNFDINVQLRHRILVYCIQFSKPRSFPSRPLTLRWLIREIGVRYIPQLYDIEPATVLKAVQHAINDFVKDLESAMRRGTKSRVGWSVLKLRCREIFAEYAQDSSDSDARDVFVATTVALARLGLEYGWSASFKEIEDFDLDI